MGVGDDIVAAGQAQRLFERTGQRVIIRGLDGRQRWADIWQGNPVLVRPDEDVDATTVATVVSGPGCRPYIVYPFSEQTGWTFSPTFRCRHYPARLYLTEDECATGRRLRNDGPYVLLEPYTKHGNFQWPLARWADLVAACPDLTFVQHIHKDSRLVPGAIPVPATFREACGLIASAAVYVRSESGLCHAAAALGTRQVTLFGACMDPEVMGYYPGQTVIASGSPCGRWLPCAHCADAMARITVDLVVDALRDQLRETVAA